MQWGKYFTPVGRLEILQSRVIPHWGFTYPLPVRERRGKKPVSRHRIISHRLRLSDFARPHYLAINGTVGTARFTP